MSYLGIPRGRRKALLTVRISHGGAGTSILYRDDVSAGSFTLNTSTWMEIFPAASVTVPINFIEVFDSSGEILEIGTGAGGGEVPFFKITPGGSGLLFARIDANTRISIKPVTTYTGASLPINTDTVINFYD